jgi:hypothetical protein
MGGWLGATHPLFPWLDWWYGAYEAFLERMLMSVILVKDAVEQARFVTNPEKLRRDGCSSRVGGGPLCTCGGWQGTRGGGGKEREKARQLRDIGRVVGGWEQPQGAGREA